jgi:hypothetical protein
LKSNPTIRRYRNIHVCGEKLGAFVNAIRRKGLIAILNMLAAPLFFPGLLFAGPDSAPQTEMTVTSNRTKDLIISITSSDGRMKGGENTFCVVFEKRGTVQPVDVLNVSVEFSLLGGRIYGTPIKGKVTEVQTGRYCGEVNLRNQYYSPASYYALVYYTIRAGKKSKQRLFLNVR